MFKEFILSSGEKYKINVNNVIGINLFNDGGVDKLIIWYIDSTKDTFTGADAVEIYENF